MAAPSPCSSGAGWTAAVEDAADALLVERRELTGDLTYQQMISGEYGGAVAVFALKRTYELTDRLKVSLAEKETRMCKRSLSMMLGAAAAFVAGGLGLATTALSASVANADPPCPPNTISLPGGQCRLVPERDIPQTYARPPGYPEGSCRPSANPPPSPNAVAASDCFNNTLPGGPPVARYEEFADQNTLNNEFQTDARSTALQPCPGSSDSAPATWNATNPPPANGSVICYTSSDNMAHVEWTNTPDRIKANVSGPDMASLYGWWHGLITTA